MSQEQERGFKVTDKRAAFQEEASSRATPESERSQAEPSSQKEAQHVRHDEHTERQDTSPPLPEANVLSLVFSLYTQAQISLGVIPDPMTQQVTKDLRQAKYSIDLLGVLKDKTQGNLTQEEMQALDQMLYEVRMTYVAVSKQ